jgi:crotonobetainyl-CoA:carnitine CoA-transferase CaiB-like acyl-CoA transferase
MHSAFVFLFYPEIRCVRVGPSDEIIVWSASVRRKAEIKGRHMVRATETSGARATLPKPLDDITVLDMTVALAGPFATLLLAGLGARVIKVENPVGGDTCRENAPYLGAGGASLVRRSADDVSVSAINRLRNKLGITLNLKHPEAHTVLADLVKKCDVLVENYSRGAIERLGVGYGWLQETNPRLVYCSITGFGSEDNSSPAKAMDTIIQAQSGMMFTSGGPQDPRVVQRGETVPLMHPKYGAVEDVYGMGMPITFSGSNVGFNQPPPALGEHNDVVYGQILGYSSERIAELRSQEVI